MKVDVLSVGAASFDLIYEIAAHPGPNEKFVATRLLRCGGGPAANAAVTVARLGGRSALVAYLGRDSEGEAHMAELKIEGVITDLVVRGASATSLSSILVKPDGQRTVINYREHAPISDHQVDLSFIHPQVILLDGHEPDLSPEILAFADAHHFRTILDAGSVHRGTDLLAGRVDYLVASERFALDYAGAADPELAAAALSEVAPNVVVTLGTSGLIWFRGRANGRMPAFSVSAVDTTGAGDAFHGAFALGVARGMEWMDLLRFATATAALCCTSLGARPAVPTAAEVASFLAHATG